MAIRNIIQQAFDKLVGSKTENQKWIDFTKKYPNCKVTNKGITYKNGKIL
jgi:hypothetical protein